MSKLLAVLVAVFAATWFAAPAFAQTGFVEICKASTGTPALTGTFEFTIDKTSYDVAVGHCSAPIAVEAPTVTIVETGHPWYDIASVNYADKYGVTHNLTAGDPADANGASWADSTITVPVAAGTIAAGTVVNVTNEAVMGSLEICKYPQVGVTLPASGTFTFSITSTVSPAVPGWMDNIAASTVPNQTVNVGSCTSGISVPAGISNVAELKTNGQLFVTGIDVAPEGLLVDEANNPDMADGSVDVTVLAASVPTPAETAVTFYNSLSTLKVCKAAGDAGIVPLSPYSFTATPGPTTAFTLTPTATDPQCNVVAQYAPGTLVTLTEATVPGTAVSAVHWNGVDFVAATGETLNMAGRTMSFFIRPGMNEVEFTNSLAQAVPLKVCKLGTGLTGTFSFATSGLAGYAVPYVGIAPPTVDRIVPTPVSTAFTVVPGQCTFVGWFPYDGTLTIAEAAGSNLTGVTTTGIYVRLAGAPAGLSAAVILGNYLTWMPSGDLHMAFVNFTNAAGVAPAPGTTPGGSPVPITAPIVTTTDQTALATIVSTTPPTKIAAPAKVMKVASARIVTVGHVRYVVVRVNGTAKTTHIHVTLINKNHKVTGSVTRYVATNKVVRVGNLKLAPSIVSVRVAL